MSQHRMDRTTDLARQSVKEPKKDLSQQRKLCRDRINMLKKQILSRQNSACCNRELQQRIKTLPQQHFHVTTKNEIWARILGIHNVASNLGPKFMGLCKESEAVSRRKTSASGELRTFLYYILLLFSFYLLLFFFSSSIRISVGLQFVYLT